MTVHPETEPVRPLHTGPARHLNVAPAEALPPLLHHSFHSDPRNPARGFGQFRPVGHRLFMNKPSGGLLAYPAVLPAGVWRPWPHRSTWTQWCESEEMDHWINYQLQAKVHLRPGTSFAVIDSAADARALADVCSLDEDPQFALLKQEMTEHAEDMDLPADLPRDHFAHHIDFTRLRDYGLTGVYLTGQGEYETRFPDPGVPSLYGWDMPTVWLCEPHYTLSTPWRSRFIGAWPHLTLAQAHRAHKAERERLMAELEEMEEEPRLTPISVAELAELMGLAEAADDDQEDDGGPGA